MAPWIKDALITVSVKVKPIVSEKNYGTEAEPHVCKWQLITAETARHVTPESKCAEAWEQNAEAPNARIQPHLLKYKLKTLVLLLRHVQGQILYFLLHYINTSFAKKIK